MVGQAVLLATSCAERAHVKPEAIHWDLFRNASRTQLMEAMCFRQAGPSRFSPAAQFDEGGDGTRQTHDNQNRKYRLFS